MENPHPMENRQYINLRIVVTHDFNFIQALIYDKDTMIEDFYAH